MARGLPAWRAASSRPSATLRALVPSSGSCRSLRRIDAGSDAPAVKSVCERQLEGGDVVDRARRQQRQVVSDCVTSRSGHAEGRSSASTQRRACGCERDLVADGGSAERTCWLRKRLRARPPPAAAVEFVQHRAAPVALLGRRHAGRRSGRGTRRRRRRSGRRRRRASSRRRGPSVASLRESMPQNGPGSRGKSRNSSSAKRRGLQHQPQRASHDVACRSPAPRRRARASARPP